MPAQKALSKVQFGSSDELMGPDPNAPHEMKGSEGFELSPEKEAYYSGRRDTMEELEQYRQGNKLPKPPKAPRPPAAPKAPTIQQVWRANKANVRKFQSLARKASGSRR